MSTIPAEIGDQSTDGLTIGDGWPANLRLDHRQELQRSGLTAETVRAAGIHTEENHAVLADLLGWDKPGKKRGAALVFPFAKATGVNGYYRVKFSYPRKERGKQTTIKYESPKGRENEVYIPPRTVEVLERADVDLVVTEGEKKSLAADQFGFPCLGLVGCYGWKPKRADRLIGGMQRVAWNGRNVFIAFDSDIAEKEEVQNAESKLAAHLIARGAVVRCVRLPAGELDDDGKPVKVGLDDFLVAHGRDGLYKLLAESIDPPEVAEVETRSDAAAMDPAPEVAGMIEADMMDGLSRLRFWRGGWCRWANGAYRDVQASEIQAKLVSCLNDRWKRVTTGIVANCLMQLRAQTILPGAVEAPAWLGEPGPWPADEVLVARNGLVHLPSFIDGGDFRRPSTPQFFSTTALDFDFDPDTPQPTAWIEFLRQLWPNDPDSVDTLREWFGYCLTPDTSQHKILFVVGPPRSGKGTIARILRAMVGAANVAGPTLASLGTNFGLWPLVGKSVAIISDARLSGRADGPAITERLLSISGEDALTIDRKMMEPVTCKLGTRFVILTNELPRLADSSGALPNRMIPLRLTESWLGREDTGLTGRLLAELPGILLWAIVGSSRLKRAGRFSEPTASADMRADMVDLASPVGAFVRDRCKVGPEWWTPTADLHAAYKQWCADMGRDHVEDQAGFGRSLTAALPNAKRKQRRVMGEQTWGYEGVAKA